MGRTKIEDIWLTLESNDSVYPGILYKRYSAEVILDVYIAIKSLEKLRCVAFKISTKLNIEFTQWDKFKDIKIETLADEQDRTKVFLLIILLNKQHKDIFSTLCEDLILGVSKVNSEKVLVEKLLERLAKWQSLFEKASQEGLSNESQRGLFGEVFYLREFLNSNENKLYCAKSWLGPEKAIQDFQFNNWAVEVKTTHGKNHQKINITSERQLDDSIIEKIFLYHLSLDVRVGNGETLNSLVDNVLELLKNHTAALNLIKLKLLESGYYDVHRSIYEIKGYSIRQENIYQVNGNFPRLMESQIPKGVGDVRYSIILSESEDWRIKKEFLFTEIRN